MLGEYKYCMNISDFTPSLLRENKWSAELLRKGFSRYIWGVRDNIATLVVFSLEGNIIANSTVRCFTDYVIYFLSVEGGKVYAYKENSFKERYDITGLTMQQAAYKITKAEGNV